MLALLGDRVERDLARVARGDRGVSYRLRAGGSPRHGTVAACHVRVPGLGESQRSAAEGRSERQPSRRVLLSIVAVRDPA